jgi:hypothetical protein
MQFGRAPASPGAPERRASDMRELFLDAQLPLFELLEQRVVGKGTIQFFLEPPFETGVLEL